MLIHFKRLFKHSLLYGIATSTQAMVNFLLVPFYTRWLKPEGFGQLEIINSLLQILVIIFSLGFGSAIIKVYIRDVKKKKHKYAVLILSLIFVMPFAGLASLVMLLYAPFFSQIILGQPILKPLIYLISLINLFSIFNLLYFGFLRAQDQSKKYARAFILRSSIILILNIFSVVCLKLGVGGILLGNLIAQIILCLFFIFDSAKKMKRASSKTVLKNYNPALKKRCYYILKKLFKFGIPIIPATIAMFIMDLSDRYFLRFMVNMSEVGIYSLGYKIGFLIFVLLVLPLQLSWPTFSFKIAKLKENKKIFAKTLTYFLIIGFSFALFCSLFSQQAIQILATKEFLKAQKIVPWVCLSYILLGAHYLIVAGLHIKEKTKYYPLMIIAPAIINLILNYFLIQQYAMLGAAIATLIAFIIMLILTYLISNHFYPIKYEYSKIAKISLLSLIILVLNYFIQFNFILKIFLLLIFIFLIWLIILEKAEKMKIQILLSKFLLKK